MGVARRLLLRRGAEARARDPRIGRESRVALRAFQCRSDSLELSGWIAAAPVRLRRPLGYRRPPRPLTMAAISRADTAMTKEDLQTIPRQAAASSGALTERLLVEKQGPVGWLTFNNPARRNAVSIDMWEAMPKALERFEEDPQVRVIVLKGEGAEGIRYYEEIADRVQERLQSCDKVVIAMIRGYCLGAGVNIALCCDLRLAAEDTRLGIPAAKLGLGYRAASLKNLIDTVGPAYGGEVLLTGRQFRADEAKSMGLVHRVVPAAELEALVLEYCTTISENAPLTIRASKRIIRELLKSSPAFDAQACTAL